MATGSDGGGAKFANYNARMKVAISERKAAGVKKTSAKVRKPKYTKANPSYKISKKTSDSIPF